MSEFFILIMRKKIHTYYKEDCFLFPKNENIIYLIIKIGVATVASGGAASGAALAIGGLVGVLVK